jgi:quinol monooxygenase YgiN
MIHATVTIAAPPGQRDHVLQFLRSLVNPTRAKPGCLLCELYENVEAANSFTLTEEWATQEDFHRRLRSETYRRLLIVMEQSVNSPTVRFRMVSDSMGMEAIFAARGK